MHRVKNSQPDCWAPPPCCTRCTNLPVKGLCTNRYISLSQCHWCGQCLATKRV